VSGERAKMWWEADEGRVHEILLDYVHTVEQRQADHFDRFAMLESMYDPNGPAAQQADPRWRQDLKRITENVIASTVDTVRSAVATTDVRARFLTDGANWSAQRRAALLEKYAEEIGKLTGVLDRCRTGFAGAAKKGNGINKVYADQDGQLHVESVPVDNIVVDDAECQNGAAPRQLHYRQVDHDRDALIQQFPEYEQEIERAQGRTGWRRRWARWHVTTGGSRNDVLVVESWRLPMGKPGTDGYRPGRHVICIEGADLLDEEWHKPFFPFAVMRWSEREGSWYGISLAERIIGHQRTLNKRNWQRDRQLDQVAVPVTYLRPVDISARVQTTNAGMFVPIKGDFPVTVVPPAVGPEIMQDRHDAKASAFEETGVSRMAATAMKPAGLESGVALREYRDQTTQRFALQEKAYERFVLDTIELLLDVCKDLGADAPVMSRRSRYQTRRIRWSDVDMNDVRVQIAAASTLNRTPAGRVQTVLEFAQAGVISMDEARRLLAHPDLEQAMSLYTAALEAIEEDLEMIEDGHFVVPEPFINLKMAVWRGQNRYLVDRSAGAPEEVLEGLRTYVVQAAHMLAQKPPEPGGMGAALPAGPDAPPAPAPQQVPAAAPPLLPPT
jgi:hypothetical protein